MTKSLTHVYTYTDKQLFQHWAEFIKAQANNLKSYVFILGTRNSIKQLKIYLDRKVVGSMFVEISDPENKDNIKQALSEIKTMLKQFHHNALEIAYCVIVDDEPVFARSIGRAVLSDPLLKKIDLRYKISVEKYHSMYRSRNILPGDIGYINSRLDHRVFNQIYAQSLEKFRQSCHVPDAQDIFQAMSWLKGVKGDHIEIGSYEGHSGWLINQFSKHYNLSRHLYLCDAFDKFPKENIGIDKFWSSTHEVNFQRVKTKFASEKNVTLVRGNIVETLPTLKSKRFSFAYIDVDSYSSTKTAIEFAYPRLNKGGVMLCEDYGESHCLGARFAIDEYFDKIKTISFFSFFSGRKIFVKL